MGWDGRPSSYSATDAGVTQFRGARTIALVGLPAPAKLVLVLSSTSVAGVKPGSLEVLKRRNPLFGARNGLFERFVGLLQLGCPSYGRPWFVSVSGSFSAGSAVTPVARVLFLGAGLQGAQRAIADRQPCGVANWNHLPPPKSFPRQSGIAIVQTHSSSNGLFPSGQVSRPPVRDHNQRSCVSIFVARRF